MVGFNIMFVFSVYLCLSKVSECDSLPRSRCPIIRLDNGRVQSFGRAAWITCQSPFRLVRGNHRATCVRGQWDTESPICGITDCEIPHDIPHGKLDILNQGSKLEVKCDDGYTIDGPRFVYCNEDLKWNEEVKGCKEHDQIYLSCNFESRDKRFCGWKNDDSNDIDWLADNMAIRNMHIYTRHVVPGSFEYFRSHYISLSAGSHGPSTTGRLISPPLLPASDKQKCLIFSYKVTSGIPNSLSELKVSFGGIPHWSTRRGEGRATIGLYQLNIISEITIEGINCKAAIDTILVTEGESCNERPYEEEIDSCHDNCGKITVGRCSCDWGCHNNNNCCSDIQIKCPFIKPMEATSKLYLPTSTTVTATVLTTAEKNKTLNVTVLDVTPSTPNVKDSYRIITTPKNGQNDTITIDQVTSASTVRSLNITSSTFAPKPTTNSTTTPESFILNTATTEVPKTRLGINITTLLSINPYSVTTSSIPKSSTIISVMDKQSNSSKTTNTPDRTTLLNTANSTIDPLIINKTLSTEKLNTAPNVIPKSSLGKTVSTNTTFVNISSSTFRPDNVNLTTPLISIPRVIITKPVMEHFSTPTIISSTLQSTVKLINSSSPTAKLFTESSTSTPLYNSTKVSIKSSVPNNAPYTTTLPNVTSSTIKPLTINITSSTVKLNITPTAITKSPTENTISNKTVVIDTSSPNRYPKPSEYNETINNINILNAPTRPPIKIEFTNNMTKTEHENSELTNAPHNHSGQIGNLLPTEKTAADNDTLDFGTITLFIAAILCIVLLRYFWLSSNNPNNDEISDSFICADIESYRYIEYIMNNFRE